MPGPGMFVRLWNGGMGARSEIAEPGFGPSGIDACVFVTGFRAYMAKSMRLLFRGK